jgi:hypothetical protein
MASDRCTTQNKFLLAREGVGGGAPTSSFFSDAGNFSTIRLPAVKSANGWIAMAERGSIASNSDKYLRVGRSSERAVAKISH